MRSMLSCTMLPLFCTELVLRLSWCLLKMLQSCFSPIFPWTPMCDLSMSDWRLLISFQKRGMKFTSMEFNSIWASRTYIARTTEVELLVVISMESIKTAWGMAPMIGVVKITVHQIGAPFDREPRVKHCCPSFLLSHSECMGAISLWLLSLFLIPVFP